MQYRYFKKKKRNIVRDGLSSQEHKKNSISLLFLWNNCIVVWRWGSMMIWPNNAKEKNDQTKLTCRKWKLEEMQSNSDRIIWYHSKASYGISEHFLYQNLLIIAAAPLTGILFFSRYFVQNWEPPARVRYSSHIPKST